MLNYFPVITGFQLLLTEITLPWTPIPWLKTPQTKFSRAAYIGTDYRVRSASNVTVITRNLPRKLRVGKIENYP